MKRVLSLAISLFILTGAASMLSACGKTQNPAPYPNTDVTVGPGGSKRPGDPPPPAVEAPPRR